VPGVKRHLVWWTYGVAIAVAVGVGWLVRAQHPIVIALVADVAATLVVFGFSRRFDNSSLYDPYWSVAPPVIALWFTLVPMSGPPPVARQVVVNALVLAWGIRLTHNWYRQWRGLGHEDWRYVDLRRKHGRRYWLVSFAGVHFFPTVLTFLGSLSLYPALAAGTALFGWLDAVALVVTAGAIWIEGAADNQLRNFIRTGPAPGTIMERGIWAYSRHPNYFGEIAFWWGLWLFGLSAAPDFWWTVVGPLAITLLFVFISIPMIERRMAERRPGFEAHRRRVSMLIPWPPKRGHAPLDGGPPGS
jgi:steroid 5-alpha reductase family enzyme